MCITISSVPYVVHHESHVEDVTIITLFVRCMSGAPLCEELFLPL